MARTDNRSRAFASAAGIALAMLAACEGTSEAPTQHRPTVGERLHAPIATGAHGALADTVTGKPYLIGDLTVCVDKAAATITSVHLHNPSGGTMTVEKWAVRSTDLIPPNEDDPGAVQGTISQYSAFTQNPVTTSCAGQQHVTTELLIQLRRDSPASATADGFRIDYKVGDKHGTVIDPYRISLCSARDRSGPCA